MPSLRLVIVNDFAYVNGGAAQVALSSAIELSRRGYDVTLFAAVGPVWSELEQEQVKVICLGQKDIASDSNRPQAARHGMWNRRARNELCNLLADYSHENTVVHLHGWTKALSSSIVKAALNRGFKIVLTMHDYFLACPNGGFFNYPSGSKCELRALSSACLFSNCDKQSYAHKLWRFGRHVIQRHFGQVPGGLSDFISISDFSHQLLASYLPERSRVHHVPNPIAIEYKPRITPSNNTGVLFLGRLDPEKGAPLLARAARDSGVKVTFVGKGPESDLISEINPEAKVTGWVARDGVLSYLTGCRAVVLPSLWYETQGLVVLEAAALGVPALVPDNSAAAEMITDGVTGLHFKSGDRESLRERLEQTKDDALVDRLGLAAYENYWRKPSTLSSHVDELQKVYQSMLAQNE